MSEDCDRAAAIVIENDRVVLIERRNSRRGKLYYLYPGGGIEAGETAEETVVREIAEETGLDVSVGRLVAVVTRHGYQQYHFLAKIDGGIFATGTGVEVTGKYPASEGSYKPIWMDLTSLLTKPVYPARVGQIIVRAKTDGWPSNPIRFTDNDQ